MHGFEVLKDIVEIVTATAVAVVEINDAK